MKVLRKGTKVWSRELACTGYGFSRTGCDALLLVELGDLLEHEYDDRDGTHSYAVAFRCPECGVDTELPDVTSEARTAAARNSRKAKTDWPS